MDLYVNVLMGLVIFTVIISFASSKIMDTVNDLTKLKEMNKIKYNLIVFSPTICCFIIVIYLITGMFYCSLS